MAVSRNDLCPCGSGKKYKKCCLGAPDPKAERKSKILLYGTLGLIVVTAVLYFAVGRGVGSVAGLASFGLLIGYALAGSGASEDPKAALAAKAAKAAKGSGKTAKKGAKGKRATRAEG